MSISLKLCFMVFLIYLCQFVQSYFTRNKPICTKLDFSTGYRTVKTCCRGYTQDKTLYSKILRCKPVCSSGCLHGICMSPENCRCFFGFVKNPATSRCEPSCPTPCYNGDCVNPYKCKCWEGFRPLNATHCEPIPCSPSCFNGDCVGPNKCKCHDGYELSGWVRDGFDYTCLPRTTTSTTTTTAVITSTEYDLVSSSSEQSLSETSTEASSSYLPPDVMDQDQVVDTDQDALHEADDIESTTELFTEDVNTALETTEEVTEESMTVIVFFGGFTEMDNNTRNDESTKSSTKYWIYIPIAILLVAVVTLLVAYRRRLLGYVKGRTYVVQGQQNKRTSRTFNVTFSSNGK